MTSFPSLARLKALVDALAAEMDSEQKRTSSSPTISWDTATNVYESLRAIIAALEGLDSSSDLVARMRRYATRFARAEKDGHADTINGWAYEVERQRLQLAEAERKLREAERAGYMKCVDDYNIDPPLTGWPL